MLGRMIGRVISGALWGAGASAVLSATRREGNGLRPLARTLMKGYVAAADRVGEVVAEARESLSDLYEEARVEREQAESEAASAAADSSRHEPHANGEPASVQ
jgi:hypothetical protein